MYYPEDTNITDSDPGNFRTFYIYRYSYRDDSIFDIPIKNIRELPNIYDLIETIKELLNGYKIKRYKQLTLYE